MMRPEPILYSASGGLTQFVEGGDTKPQVISRQKRPYAINTDYMPGINPEVLYFNPATMNPAAMTIMEDGTDVNRTYKQNQWLQIFMIILVKVDLMLLIKLYQIKHL